MRGIAVFVIAAVQLVAASRAGAQELVLTPSSPRVWDAAVKVAWLAGNESPAAGEWNDWYDVPAVSFEVGRHWTTHLKTEVALTAAGEGRFYSQERVDVPGQPFPTYRFAEHHVRSTQASGAATYQFLENSWVHPFLTAGVLVDWQRERRELQEPLPLRGSQPPFPPLIRTETERSVEVRPFVGGGFKFYVNERAFIRTDARLMVGSPGVIGFTWRGGVGVDF